MYCLRPIGQNKVIRFRLWTALACLVGLAPWADAASTLDQATPNQTIPTHVLTQAVQVLNLAPEEAALSNPTRIRGVVTCFDARYDVFFVQDHSAGVYVQALNSTQQFIAGQEVEISGVSASGLYSPMIDANKIEFKGDAQLPIPASVPIEELFTGKHDSQWVQVDGVVRRSIPEWGDWVLNISSGSSQLTVRILRSSGLSTNSWLGARIRTKGVAAGIYNAKQRLTGFHLLVPNTNQIEVLKPGALDSFALPVRSTRDIAKYSPTESLENRLRVRGVVALNWPGYFLFLKDETGVVRVETDSLAEFAVGDILDVVGYPVIHAKLPVLENAQARFVETSRDPPPIPLSLIEQKTGDNEGQLVHIEATYLGQGESSANVDSILLQSGTRVFQASLLNPSQDRGRWYPGAPGSLVRLTGIWVWDRSEDRRPPTPMLLLRTSRDIVIVAPWQTRSFHWLVWVFAGLLLTVLAIYGWRILLRGQIEKQVAYIIKRQTTLINRYRDLFESANDIIYTHDISGLLTSVNQAGEQILGYPRKEILGTNITNLVSPHERDRVAQFLKESTEGNGDQKFDVNVLTKNGHRVHLEITTRAQSQHGRVTSVQGIARDVTARKSAEEALRRSEQQLRKSAEARERLARDLHDNVIQSIYAIGLHLEDCRRTMGSNISNIDTRLAKVVAQLNTVIREVRGFLLGLRSRSIAGSELETALKSLGSAFGESFAARLSLRIDPRIANRLTSIQATQVLHIAREAVSNSVRHAAAENTVLSLKASNGKVYFEVYDDGLGFDSERLRNVGSGLRNMADRAQELGTQFSLESKPGEGTRVTIEFPP